MDYADLIRGYCAGPKMLRDAVAGMTAEQLDARSILGKWSTKQVAEANLHPVSRVQCWENCISAKEVCHATRTV